MSSGIVPFAALGAGVLTFVSPCIIPLIPAYIAFMTGLATGAGAGEGRRAPRVLAQALLFVLGFTLVFVGLGASASVLGGFLARGSEILDVVAGVLFIVFGVLMLGVIKVPWLYGEARFDMARARRFGGLAALVMGMAFALGWSPCVGPILGSILMMAADTAEAGKGAALLAIYSLGLGVPFVVTALLLDRLARPLSWLKRNSLVINRIAAVVLIVAGVLIALGQMGVFAGVLSRVIPQIGG